MIIPLVNLMVKRGVENIFVQKPTGCVFPVQRRDARMRGLQPACSLSYEVK